MNSTLKTLQNNTLAALSARAPMPVMHAIEKASAKTGVDFSYMVQQAAAESSFNPKAKAKTSSASGLYQFINSTWMNMVEKHGEKYGIDPASMSRQEILNLRFDPELASSMAAELANENKQFLNVNWGGDVGSTELYFAHFLGAGKAAGFLKARDENGLQPAAHLFPKAAAANQNVFYDSKTGRAKTLDEVYAFFDKKFQLEEPKTMPPPPPSKPERDSFIAQAQKPDAIRSNVFNNGINKGNLNGYRMAAKSQAMLSQYQNMVANPLDLILLTQLDLPNMSENSLLKSFSQKSTIF